MPYLYAQILYIVSMCLLEVYFLCNTFELTKLETHMNMNLHLDILLMAFSQIHFTVSALLLLLRFALKKLDVSGELHVMSNEVLV